MPQRVAFHEDLRVLEDDLLAMADRVGSLIERSVRALLQMNNAAASDVVDTDDKINDLFVRIEKQALEIIATQQPLATDLREILAILAIATDLERIADHAKGIGKITQRIDRLPESNALVHIDQMNALVRELLAQEMDAFVERNPQTAREVASRDDEVDKLYWVIYEEILDDMSLERSSIKEGERLLWVAKSLERCGDHVTNIGERVVFLTTGEHVELND